MKQHFIRHLFQIVLICCACSFFNCGLFTKKPIKFYISPSGNDSWSGTLAKTNSNHTDGPFLTLEKAKETTRSLKINGNLPENGIEINLCQGVYPMTKSFHLDEQDSGSKTSPIVWRNYNKEKVQLVGGKEITGFEPVSDKSVLLRLDKDSQDKILVTDLKAQGIIDYGVITPRGNPGMELFFQDKRMPLARWPNEGWVKIADVPQSGKLVNPGELPHKRHGLPVGRHYGRFTFSEDRPLRWSNVDEIVLHGYWTWDWFDEFLHIKTIDKKRQEIHIREPHSQYGYCKEQRYYAVNILEELDRPGEWFVDRKNGLLYFWPPAPLTEGKAFVSLLSDPLISLDNTEFLTVQGLFLEFSRGMAISITGGKNNLIAGCTIRNLGSQAVKIDGGENNGIVSCDIYKVASGGIALSGGDRKTLTPAGNYAVNNHIYNYSSWIRTYQAAISISGVGNRLAHNRIHDAPHSGIILHGNEHIIEYNELYQLAKETGDVGAFYMGRDWTQRGTIIRYNYFHDLSGPGLYGVNAVYLDDWSSGTFIYGNVFYKAGLGVMIGGGRNNTVENNLFIDCSPSVHVDSRGLGWAKYYFDGTTNTLFDRMDAMNYSQPPYSEKYPELLTLYDDEPAVAKYNKIQRNVSYRGKWLSLHNGLDLSVVHVKENLVYKTDQDYENKDDLVTDTDPGVVDLSEDKLRINKKSKASEISFEQIPFKNIGLYKDEYRRQVPAH